MNIITKEQVEDALVSKVMTTNGVKQTIMGYIGQQRGLNDILDLIDRHNSDYMYYAVFMAGSAKFDHEQRQNILKEKYPEIFKEYIHDLIASTM